MVVNTKYTIGGTDYTDVENAQVISSIGANNASSSFAIRLPNHDGEHSTNFDIGNEVIIYAEKNVNPATQKIITGIVENIKFSGKEQDERVVLTGRDFTARLMDSTVEPEVYNNQEVSTIVTDIIAKYVDDITVTNVSVTPTTLTHITFNQIPVYDALKQLAELSDFVFWVDVDKDLNFKEKGGVSSGVTLDNTNIIKSNFKTSDKELYNRVWVYGDRILSAWQNEFTGDGAGSVFALDYKPHNSEVIINGSSYLRGGIFEMLIGDVASGTEYLVDYDQRNIIFISGTETGDNVVGTGSKITINYDRSTPIVKYGENQASIERYGPKTKIINDKNINEPQIAADVVLSNLNQYSEPSMQGLIKIQGVVYLIASNTIVVNMSNQNISSETYDILEVRYNFNKTACLADEVLEVKVSKKLSNVTDTLKQLILDVKRLQAPDMSIGGDYIVPFTRMEQAMGSVGMRVADWLIKTKTLGSSFILGHPGTNPGGVQAGGILGSIVASGINFLGDSRATFTNQRSGGTWT